MTGIGEVVCAVDGSLYNWDNDEAYVMLRTYKIQLNEWCSRYISGFMIQPNTFVKSIRKNVVSDPIDIPKEWKLHRKPSQEWMEEFVYDSDQTHIERKELKLETDEQVVLTHDNGDRAFLVVYSANCVTIYARPHFEYIWEEDYDTKDETKNWNLYTHKVERFHVFGQWVPGNGTEKGNSVLFKVSPDRNEYLFVGHSVFTFSTTEPIVTYESDVGNSDVPYPYAVSENCIFFMLDKKWVHRKDIVTSDPYREYYDKQGVVKHPFADVDILHKRPKGPDF